MKRKSILISFIMMFCIVLTNCGQNKLYNEENLNNIQANNNEDANIASDYVITVNDMANFLLTRKTHYPISNEFIEKYQQKDGGYIDNALKAGLVVDKQLHEPNQKWHYFESWYYPSIDDGSLLLSDSAQSRVYSKLICPELLLWIYEACEVDPSKVKAAYKVAEAAKTAGTHISTMASQMRKCVPWEDLEYTILKNIDLDFKAYPVSYTESSEYSISNIKQEYFEGNQVTFTVTVTDSSKQVDYIKVNDSYATFVSGNTYKFTMPSTAVNITVSLKDKNITDDPIIDLGQDLEYKIIYDLGTKKTPPKLESATDIYNTFVYTGKESSIITDVTAFDWIYGGGRGGSSSNIWYTGNMLKFGTTTNKGSITLSLSKKVVGVKVKGYATNTACNVTIGDSNFENKRQTYSWSEMTMANIETVTANQASLIEMRFEATDSLIIAVTTAKPIYITSIEFIFE